ncbi:MAG: hypothetical protein QXW77_04365, partial [Candidatus Hadarchaeales archaeon]
VGSVQTFWSPLEAWSGNLQSIVSAPNLLLPADNALWFSDVLLTFWWENLTSTPHRLEVARDASFTQVVDNVIVPNDNRWVKLLGYRVEGTYYWRVVAVAGTFENASVTRQFQLVSRRWLGNQFASHAYTSYTLDSTSENLSFRFDASESKTVENLLLYVSGLTGTPSYRIGIQADSSGLPSGSFLSYADVTPAATGWLQADIPNLSLSGGNTYHICIQPLTADSGNYASLAVLSQLNARYPYDQLGNENLNVLYYSGSWTVENRTPVFLLLHTDGTMRGNPYRSTAAYSIYDINWVAMKFTTPEGMEVDRILVYIQRPATPEANLEWAIRISGQTTDLCSGTLATTTDNDVPVGRGGWVERDVPNFLLSGGTTYLLILRSPNTVNSANAWIWHALVAETGYEGCTYDGANSVLTSSANAGSSWSDIATRDAPFVLVRYPRWTQLESRSCTVNSPSNWVGIEGLSGTVQSVQVSWYLLDSWTDSVQVPANWLALDTWTGNGNSVAPSWLQLDLWTSSVQTIPQWCQLEAEACAVGTLAGWAAVDSWVCGANSVTPIWNLLEPWSGAVNTLVGWDPLDSWTSQVQATAAWSTVDSWTGTASSVSPSWSLLESCSGAVQTTAQWGQLDSWDAAVRVTVGWSTIEIWAGSVSTVPSSWQPLDYCSCAVQATAVWSTLDSWAGIAGSVPPTWQQLDSWTGAVQSAPTHWYLLESCSAAAQSVPCWNLLESRGGAISGLVAWLQVESLSGSVGTVPVWSALDQSTGSVTAPAAWFEVESWTGTVCAPLPVPTKPLLRRPENGAVVWDEVEVCFEWENAQYAENHRIEVALDANFTQLVDNETLVAENRWIKPLGYREGTYYWRVVAVGLGGENTSDTRVFYSRWRPIYGNQFAHSSDFDYQLDS